MTIMHSEEKVLEG